MPELETRDMVFRIQANMLAGEIMRGGGKVPRIAGYARTGSRLIGKVPGISLEASATGEGIMRLSGGVPLARMSASLGSGTVMRLSAAVPMPSIRRATRLLGAVPLPTLAAFMSSTPAARAAYAINIANAALTEYTNFAFSHFAHFRGELFAVSLTGDLYRLTGDADGSDPIEASFEIPPSNFGTTRTKSLPYVYVEAASSGPLLVTATADEHGVVAARTQTVGRNRRARLARGLRGVLWGVNVANIDGAPFAIDALDLLPMMTNRKV
jgi:hypothetical protein